MPAFSLEIITGGKIIHHRIAPGQVRIAWLPGMLASMLAVIAPAYGQSPEHETRAQQAPLADQSLLLDVIRTSEGQFVAVGERGHILLSDDGVSWSQAEAVPTRSTLTSLTSAGGKLWAAGHDTVILTSTDNGNSWSQLYFDPD